MVSFDLTDLLYQRDRKIIAFARPDLAAPETRSSCVAQVVANMLAPTHALLSGAWNILITENVGFWPKADMAYCTANIRSWG
jgi:hypothetical protein